MVRVMTVKTTEPNRWEPTRRELLGAAAAATLALLPGAKVGYGQTTQSATSRAAPTPVLRQTPWWLREGKAHARVVVVRSAGVLRVTAVAPASLGDMLDQGLRNLTTEANPVAAWRRVLGSAERILIKFNSVGARSLRITEPLARLLVERLRAAGYVPEQITLVEAPAFLTEELGTARAARGWGSAIEVGGRPEQLARYLFDADAIINVPFLKTHQIAGMSGCLKNLSHALIRRPAQFHSNGCSPYVGQVVGSREVSSRLKLNLMNAVRVVVDGGPGARTENTVGYGGLLLGFDPLAMDYAGLSILATERHRLGLPGGLAVRYLASSAEMGLGRWRPADVDRAEIEIEG